MLPGGASTPGVIGWWWALWLAGSALEWGIRRSDTPTDISGFITQDLWRLASLGFEMGSAVLAIAIVRSIVGLQEGVVSPVPQMPGVVTPVSADGQAVLGCRPAAERVAGRGPCYQRSRWTTSSRTRRFGCAIGSSGRSAG